MSAIDQEASVSAISAAPAESAIRQFSAKDIFLVGYPKSGNTWMQNLVAGVLYGFDPSLAPKALMQELVPNIHYQRSYKRFGIPMVFKSHHLPRPDFRRVIYLLRDGRDVVISELHHSATIERKTVKEINLDTFVEAAATRWAWHVEAWLRNAYAADMMIVKVEELIAHRVEELQRICEFIGVKRDPTRLALLLDHSPFQLPRGDRLTNYKDEMPLNVQQIFLERAGSVLRSAGYGD